MKNVITTNKQDIVLQTYNAMQTFRYVCEENGWGYDVLGRSGMISSPYTDEKGWTYYPLNQYKGILPQELKMRMETFREYIPGIDFIIAEEPKRGRFEIPQWVWIAAGIFALPIIMMTLGMILIPMLIIGLFLLIGVDPVVIAVLPDGTNIEIYRWFG